MSEIFRPKLFSVITKDYWKGQFTKDIMAGIIVGIVALPLAIAFAVASGVSPEKGLITAIVAGFLISFLGGSRVQIGGPTGAFIVFIYTILNQHGIEGLVISTMMAGVILVGFGLLRLGAVIKFIPHPVVVGFTSGVALNIFSSQIKDALGLQTGRIPGPFVEKWGVYFENIGTFNFWAIGITIVTILIAVYGKYLFKKIPGSFIAILLTTTVVALFNVPVNTIESVFGSIPIKFEFSLPGIHINNITQFIQPAFTIALLCSIESLLSAVVSDGMIGAHHRSNTELIAQGIANIVTPIFGGIPAIGALARTATNIKNGGRTPIAGMVHSLTLLIIMLAFGNLAKLIPMPCLAGILIVVSYNMSEWRSFKSILKGSAYEIVVLLATFLLTVLVDLTVALEIGMLLAAFLFIQRMSKLSTVFNVTTPDAANANSDVFEDYSNLPKGIDIFEISGPFFFAAARQYQEVLQDIGEKSKVVIIRMRHVPFIDSTGLHNFKSAIEFMKSKRKTVMLSGVREDVLNDLTKGGLVELIGRDYIFSTFDEALSHAKKLVIK